MNTTTHSQFGWKTILVIGAVGLIVFLAFYNLTLFPRTWFDEGSHLHVPKTLVRFGVYSDYSSEGFRHYGPTLGIGPTVLLPIAGIFKLFGVGLLQARVLMAIYLLLALYAFYNLARLFGDAKFAVVALALLMTTRGVAILEYGRQVLGEVPGLLFLIAGFWLWFRSWERTGWARLVLIGVLFGLGVITKYQYLIALAPTLVAVWILNMIYYRTAPHRVFLVPGIITAASFGLWQIYLLVYLGPATIAENFALFREVTAGAALAFSPELIRRSADELLSTKVYVGALIPSLAYGLVLSVPRNRTGQQWSVLWILIMVNLVWYVVASVSWIRYAFLGLAFSSLFIARLFAEVTRNFDLSIASAHEAWRARQPISASDALRGAMWAWLVLIIILGFAPTLADILRPPSDDAGAMANYLNAQVPRTALVESWEPEMGLLTDHNYHFPPASYLPKAVAYIWLHQPPPAQTYDSVKTLSPGYVLVGAFARWVQMYPTDQLNANYKLVKSFGEYELYERK